MSNKKLTTGKLIVFFRTWAKMKQAAFAREVWPDKTYASAQTLIRRIEIRDDIKVSELQRICKVLHVRYDDLIDGGAFIHPKVKERYIKDFGPPPEEVLNLLPSLRNNF